jgi:hypothetical protein
LHEVEIVEQTDPDHPEEIVSPALWSKVSSPVQGYRHNKFRSSMRCIGPVGFMKNSSIYSAYS